VAEPNADSESVDPRRLPLKGVVWELGPQGDGRTRVTFRNLAAVYFVDDESVDKEALLAALERSRESGEELQLTYELVGKKINGLA
jgi:hypothetical protein